MGHQSNVHGGQKDGDGNYMIGLVDLGKVILGQDGKVANTDSLEVIATGLTKTRLADFFGSDGKVGQKDKSSEARGQSLASSASKDKNQPQNKSGIKAKSTPSNIQGVVEGWKIPILAPMMAWFAIAIDNVVDDDGNPYTMTVEGFSRYCNDVFMHWHEEHIGYVLFGEEGFQQMADTGVRARSQMLINKINMLTPSSDVVADIIEKIMAEPIPTSIYNEYGEGEYDGSN